MLNRPGPRMTGPPAAYVQTVLGPIAPSELGVTVTHEHLLLDITCYTTEAEHATGRAVREAPITMDALGDLPSRFLYSIPNMRLIDERAAAQEAARFRRAGGDSIVETTSATIGRDPLAYARISRATGLNVVMGCGYYVSPSHPPDMADRTAESIAEEIVRDLTVGVGGTGVRSGVIGEVGCSVPLHPDERRSLVGSAMAQRETGAAITLHAGGTWERKREILDALVEGGADPARVIFGHSDGFVDREGLRMLAGEGCYVQLDVFGWEDTSVELALPGFRFVNDAERLAIIAALAEMGFIDRVLVSQDVCQPWQYVRTGGKGFAHHLENIVPRMRRMGFGEGDVRRIFVDNPARALAIDPR